jgi:hypothetical protein
MTQIARCMIVFGTVSLAIASVAVADSEWCFGSAGDRFAVTVADSSITVSHIGAGYNCAQDSIEVQVSVDLDRISIHEYEHPPGGYVMCMCCYVLSATVERLTPGAYRVEYAWREWPHADWSVWDGEVVIPGARQDGIEPVVRTSVSSCLGTDPGDDTPEATTTWSSIKALFR